MFGNMPAVQTLLSIVQHAVVRILVRSFDRTLACPRQMFMQETIEAHPQKDLLSKMADYPYNTNFPKVEHLVYCLCCFRSLRFLLTFPPIPPILHCVIHTISASNDHGFGTDRHVLFDWTSAPLVVLTFC